MLPAVAAVLLGGCGGGGGPHMARRDAAPLITLADRIAREAPCAQARDIRLLRTRTIALVNSGPVPHALQEPLLSGVNAFVEPPCLPAVPSDSTPTYVAPTPTERGHGHGHGHQNHGGEGGD